MNKLDKKVILSKIDEIDFNNEDDKYLKIVQKLLFENSKNMTGIHFNFDDERAAIGEKLPDNSWILVDLAKTWIGPLDKDKLLDLLSE